MRLVRISLALKRMRSQATSPPAAMPPASPAAIIAGNTIQAGASGSSRATPPPQMAPRVNWPSVPMFQRLAR